MVDMKGSFHRKTLFARGVSTSLICAVLIISSLSSTCFGRTPAAKPKFELLKGHGMPACEAYLRHLNSIAFTNSPMCDRFPEDPVGGLEKLERVSLSPDEVFALQEKVMGFVQTGDQDVFAKMHEERKRLHVPVYPLQTLSSIEHDLHRILEVWRYSPQVDVDNDGTPDNVIMWQGLGSSAAAIRCGARDLADNVLITPTVPFVLSADGTRIDVRRTRTLFGFQSLHEHGVGAEEAENQKYKPMGTTVGIFKFRGRYYFDSFYKWGAAHAKNRSEVRGTVQRLSVYFRQNDVTKQVCEIRWNDGGER